MHCRIQAKAFEFDIHLVRIGDLLDLVKGLEMYSSMKELLIHNLVTNIYVNYCKTWGAMEV